MPLAEFFREIANNELECSVTGLDAEARKTLLTHPWPGNVRELRNIIERAITLSDDETIDLAHLQTAPLRSPIAMPTTSFSTQDENDHTVSASPMGSKKLPP